MTGCRGGFGVGRLSHRGLGHSSLYYDRGLVAELGTAAAIASNGPTCALTNTAPRPAASVSSSTPRASSFRNTRSSARTDFRRKRRHRERFAPARTKIVCSLPAALRHLENTAPSFPAPCGARRKEPEPPVDRSRQPSLTSMRAGSTSMTASAHGRVQRMRRFLNACRRVHSPPVRRSTASAVLHGTNSSAALTAAAPAVGMAETYCRPVAVPWRLATLSPIRTEPTQVPSKAIG